MERGLAQRIYELPGASARFASMEGLRAYAALLIFLVHYFDDYARRALGVDLNALRLDSAVDPVTKLAYWLFASHYGVDLFFLLSGFLIYRIVTREGFAYLPFARGRVARIYPAFLVSLATWMAIRIGLQGMPLDGHQFLGNLFFLNAVPALHVVPYNMVTWTLFFEFAFYLSFPLILLLTPMSRRVGPWHIALFGALCAWLAMHLGGLFIRIAMFYVGAWMASWSRPALERAAARFPDSLVAILYMASTLYFAQVLGYRTFIPVFAVTSFLLVLKVVYGEGWLHRLFAWRWLRYLGNCSYSFYLVHGLAIEVVMQAADSWLRSGPSWHAFLVTFIGAWALAVALATALFLIAEKPYFARKRRARPVHGDEQVPARGIVQESFRANPCAASSSRVMRPDGGVSD